MDGWILMLYKVSQLSRTYKHTGDAANIQTSIHPFIHTYKHIDIHPYIHINIHPSIQTYTVNIHPSIHIYMQACSINPSVFTDIHFLAHSFFFCPGNKNKSCSQRAHEKKEWTGKRRREPKRVVCYRGKKSNPKRIGYTFRYSSSLQGSTYSGKVLTAST